MSERKPLRANAGANVDTQAAAAYLRVAPGTVRRWASEGRITRAGRRGRRSTYSVEELTSLLTQRGSR